MNKQKWMQVALDLGMEGLEITTARYRFARTDLV